MSRLLKTMLAYKCWANRRLFSAVDGLGEEILSAPQPIKFGSLIKTLQHAYDMDVVWRAHLTGTNHGIASRVPQTTLSLAELAVRQSEIDEWYSAFFSSLTLWDFDRAIRFQFLSGEEGRMTTSEILTRVVNHGTYHRGHVADMLYHAGVVPPITDYPVFIRETAQQ